jgi:hypothetical protein
MGVVNFHLVERFLADPGIPSAELIHSSGRENTRVLLRRAVGESSGWLFEQWEWMQLAVGLCLLLVLIFGDRPPMIPIALVLLMMALVLVERFALTGNIIRLARVVDFLPPDPKLPDRVSFGRYHSSYAAVEIAKLLAGFAIAIILIVRTQPDPQMFARAAGLDELDAQPRRGAR